MSAPKENYGGRYVAKKVKDITRMPRYLSSSCSSRRRWGFHGTAFACGCAGNNGFLYLQGKPNTAYFCLNDFKKIILDL